MKYGYYIFSDSISTSILEFLLFSFDNNCKSEKITIYITGDAIYSLFNFEFREIWNQLDEKFADRLRIVIDLWESKILGVDLSNLPNNCGKIWNNYSQDFEMNHPLNFWRFLVRDFLRFGLVSADSPIGFLQMEGPYMSRNSVYCIRLLEAAKLEHLNPELYAYLDGLHLLKSHQSPSEFENIGESLINIFADFSSKSAFPSILGCSRCATARGYCTLDEKRNFNPLNVIPPANIVNLNEIVEKFHERFPILSSNAAFLHSFSQIESVHQKNFSPSIIIIISHTPYHSEWAFGGISLAIACANQGIETKVIFLEQGIHALRGNHQISQNDCIFNIQEILIATADMEHLNYFYYCPNGQEMFINPILTPEIIHSIHNLDSLHPSKSPNGNQNFYLCRLIFF